jgi:hypothetical protein
MVIWTGPKVRFKNKQTDRNQLLTQLLYTHSGIRLYFNVCDAFEAGHIEGCHLQGLVNGNNATVLSLDFIIFGSFRPDLRSLFNRFTQTIYDNENDAYCRSLSSIRKYYTNLWSITYLSMSAIALTKARNILLSLTMLMMPNATN